METESIILSTLPSMFERMDDDAILGNFLGLLENENVPDIIIASIPYELTTSYGQGTENGLLRVLKQVLKSNYMTTC